MPLSTARVLCLLAFLGPQDVRETQAATPHCDNHDRPALSGGMDWWRMKWPFSRVRRIFLRGRNLQDYNSAERAILTNFQAPNVEFSEPGKMQCHTLSHSIPPLDSLLNEEWVPFGLLGG